MGASLLTAASSSRRTLLMRNTLLHTCVAHPSDPHAPWCSPECLVRGAFREADIEGLIGGMGAPGDEYDSEADASLDAATAHHLVYVLTAPDPSAIVRIVRETCRRSFGIAVERDGSVRVSVTPAQAEEHWPDERLRPLAEAIARAITWRHPPA